MNERNIFVVAVLILVGAVVFSNLNSYSGYYTRQKERCESDTGYNIYLPQVIRYWSDPASVKTPQILRSKCATSNTLSAVYCVDEASPERYVIDCPTDYVCFDSAEGAYCKKGDELNKEGGCIDSDDGNIYEKGIVLIPNSRGRGLDEEAIDICATENTVLETTCASGDNSIKKEILGCPYPYKCVDGACKKS